MEKESGVRPINGDDYEYDGEQFEEDEATLPPRRKLSGELDQHQQSSLCSWKTIDLGEIELGEQLGGGSVGLVHRGIYRGELVALKMLFNRRIDDDLTREYVDELLLLSQLRHPNIVHFYGAGVPPNHFYVLELCERSLFDLLHNCRRPLQTPKRVSMAILWPTVAREKGDWSSYGKYELDVSKAMEYLHSRAPPVLHRDLKSLNLLLAREDGPVKLCDFGLVRTTVTSAGTPAYMAPELLENRPFNKSVDVYAFGILLWEIFSRDIPFNGFSAADVHEAVGSGGRPKVPTGYVPEIGQLMCQCWDQDPLLRPPFVEIEDTLQLQLRSASGRTELEGMHNGDCLDDLIRK